MSELPNFIPTPVWGFKQSNTDFICAVGRRVKFIDPIDISQISVYKQIGQFVYKFLFIHFHVKNYIFNDKTIYLNI